MEGEIIDYIFWGAILLIIAGGITCLLIFLPREHKYEEERRNCYRVMYRDGSYSISSKKATYGENRYSIRSKYFYITRVPFQVDAYCDEAVANDGKNYRASASVTVFFPEDKLQQFAVNFHGVSQESIEETVGEALTASLTDTMKEYDSSAGEKEFGELFKKAAGEKLALFGLIIMNINSMKISEVR